MANEVMCKEEYKEFCAIKNARRKTLEKLERGQITHKEYREECNKLLNQLDELQRKYD